MDVKFFGKKICFSLFSSVFALGCIAATTRLSADNLENNYKKAVDEIADSCKKGIEKLGNEIGAIQEYLENYNWKGLIQEKATSGIETLRYLRLNDHSRVVAVKGGEKIQGVVLCSPNTKKASLLSVYRVVIGYKGLGPQTTIAKSLGANVGESLEVFSLKAPLTPGFYQIRFRTTDKVLEASAKEAWYDDFGNEPDASSTIGVVYVMP